MTAVWVGYDNPASLGEDETGGKVAAPIFHDFMAEALKDHPNLAFNPPEGMFIVPNPAGGQDAFKSTEDPNAVTTLVSDPNDTTTPDATPGSPAAAATIDSNVGGVY